jgi:hypothetical protein
LLNGALDLFGGHLNGELDHRSRPMLEADLHGLRSLHGLACSEVLVQYKS